MQVFVSVDWLLITGQIVVLVQWVIDLRRYALLCLSIFPLCFAEELNMFMFKRASITKKRQRFFYLAALKLKAKEHFLFFSILYSGGCAVNKKISMSTLSSYPYMMNAYNMRDIQVATFLSLPPPLFQLWITPTVQQMHFSPIIHFSIWYDMNCEIWRVSY